MLWFQCNFYYWHWYQQGDCMAFKEFPKNVLYWYINKNQDYLIDFSLIAKVVQYSFLHRKYWSYHHCWDNPFSNHEISHKQDIWNILHQKVICICEWWVKPKISIKYFKHFCVITLNIHFFLCIQFKHEQLSK